MLPDHHLRGDIYAVIDQHRPTRSPRTDRCLPLAGVDANAASAVSFSKVQYDSPGNDIGSNKSLNNEWVVVTNHGSNPKELTGWTIRDPQGHIFKFATSFKLKPGQSVKVHTGKGTDTTRICTGVRTATSGTTRETKPF